MPSIFQIALVVLLSLAAAAYGQADRLVDIGPTLSVTGEAQVSARPDRAVVVLGAIAQSEQADAAQQQINQIMTRAIAAVRDAGIAEEQIQTAGLSLYPVYTDHQPRAMQNAQEPRIIGYRASNTVRVTVDDLAAIGRVIDAGIKAGANQLQGVTFELKDDTAQRAEALKQAAANARAKATALAAATGVTLESMHGIVEGGVQVIPPPMYRAAPMVAMEAGTPVQPGQIQVQANVTITYRIANNQVRDAAQ